jgi:hypothetical protein
MYRSQGRRDGRKLSSRRHAHLCILCTNKDIEMRDRYGNLKQVKRALVQDLTIFQIVQELSYNRPARSKDNCSDFKRGKLSVKCATIPYALHVVSFHWIYTRRHLWLSRMEHQLCPRGRRTQGFSYLVASCCRLFPLLVSNEETARYAAGQTMESEVSPVL